jgi:hypothetical protein
MRLTLTIVLVAAAVAGVQAARATTAPDFANVFGCSLHGGHTTVAAGTPLQARGGWAGKNRGLVQDFLGAQSTSLSVDGGSAVDMAYGPITQGGPDDWGVRFAYGLPALAAGRSMTVVESLSLSHPVPDGVTFQSDDDSKPFFWGPGTLVWACTLTAV